MTDNLDRIFQLQKQLDRRIESDNPDKVADRLTYDVDKRINAKAQAIIHEAVEVQRLTGWKWWKKQVPPINRLEALEELSDILHFVISSAIDLDCSAQEFYEIYVGKNKENHGRQDRKY